MIRPLTTEEQLFASEHHNLIYKFLYLHRLNIDEYYDVVIFRYLNAVIRWFQEDELHMYSFTTIAFGGMRSALSNHYRSIRNNTKYGIMQSLEAPITNTETLSISDTIADPHDQYLQLETIETIREEFYKLDNHKQIKIYKHHINL